MKNLILLTIVMLMLIACNAFTGYLPDDGGDCELYPPELIKTIFPNAEEVTFQQGEYTFPSKYQAFGAALQCSTWGLPMTTAISQIKTENCPYSWAAGEGRLATGEDVYLIITNDAGVVAFDPFSWVDFTVSPEKVSDVWFE